MKIVSDVPVGQCTSLRIQQVSTLVTGKQQDCNEADSHQTDSDESTKASYTFDNEVEWLEWKYLPDATNFTEGRKLIVVHGVQSDEGVRTLQLLRENRVLVCRYISVLLVKIVTQYTNS